MDNTEKLKELIKEIAPFLEADGGNIEFVKYEDNYLYVRLSGHCENCEMMDVTLKDGVLNYVKEQVPEVIDVINVPL